MRDFRGRVAVVTGAASGIGLASALALAGEGMKLALLDLRADALRDAVAQVQALGAEAIAVPVDVGDAGAVEAAAKTVEGHFGQINFVMNNAAVFFRGPPIETIGDDVWSWLLRVNLYGVLHGIRAFVPRIRATGESGHVVNTASISGLWVGDRRSGVYAASKFAVIALSEALAHDLRNDPIGVSVLIPGLVASDFYETSAQHRGSLWGPGEFDRTPPDIQAGMPPTEVARRLLAGLKAGQFYIPTHPANRGLVEERFRQLMAGYDFMAEWERGAR